MINAKELSDLRVLLVGEINTLKENKKQPETNPTDTFQLLNEIKILENQVIDVQRKILKRLLVEDYQIDTSDFYVLKRLNSK